MKDIRIRFRKLGRAKYISHLDLTRTMARAIRRAELPIWYTEGFNRHPYLTFAAPLSLGFEGLTESMDIRIIEEMPMQEIVSRLNANLPEGLEVYAAGEPAMKAGEIAFAKYHLTFDHAELLQYFLAQDGITAQKRSKKGVMKEVDCKPYLENAVLTDDRQGAAQLDILLPCGSENNVNPMLIVGAYQEYAGRRAEAECKIFCDVLRLELLDKDKRPFL